MVRKIYESKETKEYYIEVWETEDDRNLGEGNIVESGFTNKEIAIRRARKIMHMMDYAYVEVSDGEKTVFSTDGVKEELSESKETIYSKRRRKVEKFSFKDSHKCSKCGKSLADCDCKLDTVKEEEPVKEGLDCDDSQPIYYDEDGNKYQLIDGAMELVEDCSSKEDIKRKDDVKEDEILIEDGDCIEEDTTTGNTLRDEILKGINKYQDAFNDFTEVTDADIDSIEAKLTSDTPSEKEIDTVVLKHYTEL